MEYENIKEVISQLDSEIATIEALTRLLKIESNKDIRHEAILNSIRRMEDLSILLKKNNYFIKKE